MVILGVAALLLLGGGGAGAYFFLFSPDADASVNTGKDGEHAKEDGHAKKDDHNSNLGGGHTAYIELEPLLLPIIDEYGVSQTVTMRIALELTDADKALSIQQMKPKLNNAYIRDMYGALNEYALLKGGVIEVGIVKQRLHRITNEVLGDNIVNAVLLEMVNQQEV